MNKRLEDALSKVRDLPDEEQAAVADLLFEFLDAQRLEAWLSPDQLAEIERRLASRLPYASDDEVQATFDRLTK